MSDHIKGTIVQCQRLPVKCMLIISLGNMVNSREQREKDNLVRMEENKYFTYNRILQIH